MSQEIEVLPKGTSQTLHTGLRVLDHICSNPEGLTIAEISSQLDIDRTAVHRIVRTLEFQDIIVRDAFKRFRPGWKLVAFGESVQSDLRSVAKPVLAELANDTASTSHLLVPVDAMKVMALDVIQPDNADVHVAFKAGQQHPMDRGSGGMAMLAARPSVQGERTAIAEARQKGYAVSRSEVVPSMFGISSAVVSEQGEVVASVGVSVFEDNNLQELAECVRRSAREIANSLRLVSSNRV